MIRWLLLFLLPLLFLSGCACSDDDDSGGDQTQTDDDDNDNDDNDNDDNDNDDNDDNDDDSSPPFESLVVYDDGRKRVEMIAGGNPGVNGLSIGRLTDGTLAAAFIKGRTLLVTYVKDGQIVSRDVVAHGAILPAVAVKPSGELNILYQDTIGNRLVVASKKGREWQFEKLTDYTYRPGLGLYKFDFQADSDGFLHAAFLPDIYKDKALYATDKSGDWVVEEVDSGDGSYKQRPRLALDSDNRPHLVYALVFRKMMYAAKTEQGWLIETAVDGSLNTRHSIAVGSDDSVYVFFNGDSSNNQAIRSESGWTVENIDLGGLRIGDSFVEMGAAGTLSLVFSDLDSDYVWKAMQVGDLWAVDPIEDGYASYPFYAIGIAGERTVLLLAEMDRGKVSSLEQNEEKWQETLLDSSGEANVGEIALDGVGNPFVGLRITQDEANAVWLADSFDGQWRYSQADSEGTAPALALDEGGNAHLAYWRDGVIHATDRTGEWMTETIYSGLNEDMNYIYYDLALDNEGNPAIVAVGNVQDIVFANYSEMIYSRGPDWTIDKAAWWNEGSDYTLSLLFDDQNVPGVLVSWHCFSVFGDVDYEALFYYWPAGKDDWSYEYVEVPDPSYAFRRMGGQNDAVRRADGTVFVSYATDFFGTMMSTGDLIADNGDWVRANIPDQMTNGIYLPTAIALSPAGEPVVAFAKNTATDAVIVAVKSGQTWRTTTVDIGYNYGSSGLLENGSSGLDMAIDADGLVHLIYNGDGAAWHLQMPLEDLAR